MNLTDDQLREALRVTGDEVHADRLRPLALPMPESQRRDIRRLRDNRWLPAVAAATAVIAIAATAVAIGTGADRRPGAEPQTATVRGLPPYYVAISQSRLGAASTATVRDIRTGMVLATVQPPQGFSFIDAVTGPTQESFLLEATKHGAVYGTAKFYLLRFNRTARSTGLTRLPIPAQREAASLAISPAGTEVAVSSQAGNLAQVRIYAMSGRLIRHWQDQGTVCSEAGSGLPCLSWAASGFLAFIWSSQNNSHAPANGLRLIRASAASGSLVGESRLVLPSKTFKGPIVPTFLLSGNGTTIAVIGEVRPYQNRGWQFEEISVATGKLTRLFRQFRPVRPPIGWWISRTGSTLIVSSTTSQSGRPGSTLNTRYGVLTRQRFTPLPLAPSRDNSWFGF